jgi:carbon monoxide dehydrogenase subunit G
MSLDIEEQLELEAPVDRVWKFLIDPEKIVTCLPGAELTKVEDARTFLGNMKVKVGPVSVAYQGRVRLVDVDEAAHRVKMSGEGTEKGGAGSAKMQMESEVVATEGGGSRVVVKSQVDLAGRIVQFGRGMIKGVAAQLFKQFGENLKAAVAAAEPEAPSAAVAAGADSARTERPTTPLATIAARNERPTTPVIAARKVEPVRILPLIFKAMVEPIVRFFRRLFGRR